MAKSKPGVQRAVTSARDIGWEILPPKVAEKFKLIPYAGREDEIARAALDKDAEECRMILP